MQAAILPAQAVLESQDLVYRRQRQWRCREQLGSIEPTRLTARMLYSAPREALSVIADLRAPTAHHALSAMPQTILDS